MIKKLIVGIVVSMSLGMLFFFVSGMNTDIQSETIFEPNYILSIIVTVVLIILSIFLVICVEWRKRNER